MIAMASQCLDRELTGAEKVLTVAIAPHSCPFHAYTTYVLYGGSMSAVGYSQAILRNFASYNAVLVNAIYSNTFLAAESLPV